MSIKLKTQLVQLVSIEEPLIEISSQILQGRNLISVPSGQEKERADAEHAKAKQKSNWDEEVCSACHFLLGHNFRKIVPTLRSVMGRSEARGRGMIELCRLWILSSTGNGFISTLDFVWPLQGRINVSHLNASI